AAARERTRPARRRLRRSDRRSGGRERADDVSQPGRGSCRQAAGPEDFPGVRGALSHRRADRAQPVAGARLVPAHLCPEAGDLVDRPPEPAHRGERGTAALGGAAAVGAELIAAARAAQGKAYAPHSGFRVGAALRFADGSIVTGSNVENASYGLSLCAETVAVARAFNEGRRGGLLEVAVTASGGDVVTPCGRCRQVLHELA